MFVAALLLVLGCAREEPVLTGIPADPLLSGTQSAAEVRAEPEAPSKEPVPYAKPEGVFVDVGHLAGQRFTASRDIVADQLGGLTDTRALGSERGEELRFDRGTLRVVDDTIYMMSIPLPEPLRRHEALAALGLPAIVDRYNTLDDEYRFYNELGFRRVHMKRVSDDSELVTTVEAWRWLPREHLQRR